MSQDLDLDFGAIEGALAEQAARQAAGGGSSRLIIKDGASTRLRVLGGPNQPYRFNRHWINIQGKKGYEICATGVQGFDGCSCCHYRSSSNAIGGSSPCLAFSCISDKYMHIIEKGENEKNEYHDCKNQPWHDTQDKACQLCTAGSERKREGRKYWDIAPKHAKAINLENGKLRKRCACGIGQIKVTHHECPECGERIDLSGMEEGVDKLQCGACEEIVRPSENVACTNCDNPRRRSVTDCWLVVTRVGGGTDTTYSFDPEPPSKLSGDDAAITPFDFKAQKKPRDQSVVAVQKLGKGDPFGPAAGSEGSDTIFGS